MSLFKYRVRWPAVAATWDDETTSRIWRMAVEILEQRDRDLENYLRLMLSTPDAWTDYTPTWTSSGVAPVLNNGTLAGRYVKVGRKATAQIGLTIGSTTTVGTGNWTFSLPVAQVATVYTEGNVRIVDVAPAAFYEYGAYAEVNNVIGLGNAANSFVGAAVPIAVPATGDSYFYQVTYETAG